MNAPLRKQVIKAARSLIMANGYEAVGMRDIAKAVGKEPVQIYRLGLSKTDILAEVIIELNQRQIAQLPKILQRVSGTSSLERTCAYLLELYKLDIRHMPIRAVGAAVGWTWSPAYESRVVVQVIKLLEPVAGWLNYSGLDDIPSRCMGIWSLYYVGYRRAVIHGESANGCLASIKSSLRFFFAAQTP